MTIIRSLEQSSEGPEARVVKRYHTSTALPGDYKGLLKEHGESMQTLLFQDGAGNTLSEEQMSAILPKIAESISKLENTEAQEILPGITQSITKLKNGGNLVITTMTRQIEDQEQEEHPVIHVDDLENSKLYLVNDSRGELYYVEDITEESEQSSHYSSHTNNNEYQTISKIKSNGNNGIRDSTAQEILSTMFGGNDVQEMREIDEEWNERSYDYEIPCRRSGYSKDAFKTPYMVEEPGGTLPRVKVASNENYQTSHQTAASGAMMNYYDSSMVQNYSQTLQGIYGGDDTHSVTTVSLPTADNGSRTIERYIIDGEIIEYPLAPPPIFLPPLPICIQTGSNYSLVKVDETPKPLNQPLRVRTPETPIYETMTTVKTSIEPLPPPRSKPKPKPKLTQTEVQESHIRFDEVQEEKCIRFDKVIKEEKPDVEESRYSYDESDVVIRGSYTENNADGNQMALVRRKGQSLSEYLLSRLKHVENVDIQQKIAVKHNSDDFHGNPRHLNADGRAYDGNFNTVHEKVDLFIKDGKAQIVVTVTAERVYPVDMQFDVWRRKQAVVTRTINVDLMATQHRRQVYQQVMRQGQEEAVLDGIQTLDLFTRILGPPNFEPVEGGSVQALTAGHSMNYLGGTSGFGQSGSTENQTGSGSFASYVTSGNASEGGGNMDTLRGSVAFNYPGQQQDTRTVMENTVLSNAGNNGGYLFDEVLRSLTGNTGFSGLGSVGDINGMNHQQNARTMTESTVMRHQSGNTGGIALGGKTGALTGNGEFVSFGNTGSFGGVGAADAMKTSRSSFGSSGGSGGSHKFGQSFYI